MSASNPPSSNGPSSGATRDPSGPTLLAQVQGVLRRNSELRLALLFGSQAHGTARTDSDVDLAVAAERPLQATELITLIGERVSPRVVRWTSSTSPGPVSRCWARS